MALFTALLTSLILMTPAFARNCGPDLTSHSQGAPRARAVREFFNLKRGPIARGLRATLKNWKANLGFVMLASVATTLTPEQGRPVVIGILTAVAWRFWVQWRKRRAAAARPPAVAAESEVSSEEEITSDKEITSEDEVIFEQEISAQDEITSSGEITFDGEITLNGDASADRETSGDSVIQAEAEKFLPMTSGRFRIREMPDAGSRRLLALRAEGEDDEQILEAEWYAVRPARFLSSGPATRPPRLIVTYAPVSRGTAVVGLQSRVLGSDLDHDQVDRSGARVRLEAPALDEAEWFDVELRLESGIGTGVGTGTGTGIGIGSEIKYGRALRATGQGIVHAIFRVARPTSGLSGPTSFRRFAREERSLAAPVLTEAEWFEVRRLPHLDLDRHEDREGTAHGTPESIERRRIEVREGTSTTRPFEGVKIDAGLALPELVNESNRWNEIVAPNESPGREAQASEVISGEADSGEVSEPGPEAAEVDSVAEHASEEISPRAVRRARSRLPRRWATAVAATLLTMLVVEPSFDSPSVARPRADVRPRVDATYFSRFMMDPRLARKNEFDADRPRGDRTILFAFRDFPAPSTPLDPTRLPPELAEPRSVKLDTPAPRPAADRATSKSNAGAKISVRAAKKAPARFRRGTRLVKHRVRQAPPRR